MMPKGDAVHTQGDTMRFEDFAVAVDSLPWPSIGADATARDALAVLTRPGGEPDKEVALDNLALLLWWLTVAARVNGVALSSVADRSLAMLSKMPPARNGMEL
jgi:hypothetical protein